MSAAISHARRSSSWRGRSRGADRPRESARRRECGRACSRTAASRFGEPASSSPSRMMRTLDVWPMRASHRARRSPRGTRRSATCRPTTSGRRCAIRDRSRPARCRARCASGGRRAARRSLARTAASYVHSDAHDRLAVVVEIERERPRGARHTALHQHQRRAGGRQDAAAKWRRSNIVVSASALRRMSR